MADESNISGDFHLGNIETVFDMNPDILNDIVRKYGFSSRVF